MARVVAWLEGDVLAKYVRFLEEAEAAQLPGLCGVKWLEGDVLADFLEFLGEDMERAAPYSVSSGSGGSNSGEFMKEDKDEEEEEEMAYMLRNIMSPPAVMARAAALQD